MERTSSPRKVVTRGKTRELPYRRPWSLFAPTLLCFILFNYFAFGTTINDDGTDIVPTRLISGGAASVFRAARVLLENHLIRNMFIVSRFFFHGIGGIRVVCMAAWLLHCIEAVVAAWVCSRCGADRRTFGLYVVMTLFGGVTQLGPLLEAQRTYLGKAAGARGAE
uniref:Uncharacterized protein n=1 Tax=Trypanosoma congolense (strain IL3000) TaxID=1068625 RepID=G0UVD3_TRYCI|nr:conserved hypothetical protein [Trypanosoma congolense IL3000]